jgi:predicted TIM-barrel fold metal-dependent hydrolase
MLEHLGGPVGVGAYADRAQTFRIWRAGIREVARCANAMVKLSGLGMPICGFGFDRMDRRASSVDLAAAWRPYVEDCIAAFGVSRCMFASNAPVDAATASYRVLWNALKQTVSGCSESEKDALLSGTAARLYRIDAAALAARPGA